MLSQVLCVMKTFSYFDSFILEIKDKSIHNVVLEKILLFLKYLHVFY